MDEDTTAGLTIAEAAAKTGLTAHTLRYYERAGLITPVERDASGRRRYAESDLAWLRFLVRLRETGMPIAHMRSYAALRADGPATNAARLAILTEHQANLRAQLDRLIDHDAALQRKIDSYREQLAAAGEDSGRSHRTLPATAMDAPSAAAPAGGCAPPEARNPPSQR